MNHSSHLFEVNFSCNFSCEDKLQKDVAMAMLYSQDNLTGGNVERKVEDDWVESSGIPCSSTELKCDSDMSDFGRKDLQISVWCADWKAGKKYRISLHISTGLVELQKKLCMSSALAKIVVIAINYWYLI